MSHPELFDVAIVGYGPTGAVAAGLLALSGKNEQAYQIAERVPEMLLLDEERQFLQRAK